MNSNPTPGLHYVGRDGQRIWHLEAFLAGRSHPGELPRPERDILAALLRFCLEGVEHMNAIERETITLPSGASD